MRDQALRDAAGPSSLAAEAYSIVRGRIVRGEIGIGQVISRRKIAAELSMSFLPVSEALLRLEFEGLLESRPRAGTRVRIPAPEDVKGHFVVREALEVQAALLFQQVATEQERADLRQLAERVDVLSIEADRTPFLEVHQKLHAGIAQCTKCTVLLDAIEKTHALASIWFCVMRAPREDDSPTRHRDLVDAICSNDPVRATEMVRQHLADGMRWTLDVLEPYFRLRKATGRTFYRSDRQLKLH